jgi:hypothetical protein
MIMKLQKKNQRPGPKGAVESVKEKEKKVKRCHVESFSQPFFSYGTDVFFYHFCDEQAYGSGTTEITSISAIVKGIYTL